ncbi:hypothetical protein V2J09_016812 [Rumex salicifolius]
MGKQVVERSQERASKIMTKLKRPATSKKTESRALVIAEPAREDDVVVNPPKKGKPEKRILKVPYYLGELTEKFLQDDRIQGGTNVLADQRARKIVRFKRQRAAESMLLEIKERKERRGRSTRAAALSTLVDAGEEDISDDDGEEEREAYDLLEMLKKEEDMLSSMKELQLQHWDTKDLKDREHEEIKVRGFGLGYIRDPPTKLEQEIEETLEKSIPSASATPLAHIASPSLSTPKTTSKDENLLSYLENHLEEGKVLAKCIRSYLTRVETSLAELQSNGLYIKEQAIKCLEEVEKTIKAKQVYEDIHTFSLGIERVHSEEHVLFHNSKEAINAEAEVVEQEAIESPHMQAFRPKLQYVRKVAKDRVAGEVAKEQVNATTTAENFEEVVQDKVAGEHVEELCKRMLREM